MLNGFKSFLESKTIRFALATIAASIFGLFKIEISPENIELILVSVSTLIGGVGAIYGRIKATDKIQ